MTKENILIFGDSYSTYEGFIPEGYVAYYPKEGEMTVRDVSKTWWGMLAQETESEIVLNNSWSGSTVCNTGYGGDCSQTSSFIFRLNQLIDKGFFEKNRIDRVFVFGGTNDSWTENACGPFQYADWTPEDLLLILPGYAYFMNLLMTVVPKEKIHAIVNTELRQDVTEGIAEICAHYGIKLTQLYEIDKFDGHPTHTGMTAIKNQILSDIND